MCVWGGGEGGGEQKERERVLEERKREWKGKEERKINGWA